MATKDEEKRHSPFQGSPWYIKTTAITSILFLSVGSHFLASAISALKTTELGIDNTRYGLLSSSVSLLNTILPMIGGRVMDKLGPRISTITATTLILLGSGLTTAAAQSRSFTLIILGRLVFGLGSGVIITLQESILATWFTSTLGLAFSLQLASSEISGFVGTLVANPLAQSLGWVAVFWLAFGLCVFSSLMNLAYLFLVPPPLKEVAMKYSNPVMALSGIVWLIVVIEGVLSMVWAAFRTIVTEYIMMRDGGEGAVHAGITASVSQIVPIVLGPVIGVLIDRYGRRVTILTVSTLCLELCCVFLGYFTIVPAIVSMLLFSVSLTLGPLPMHSCLALLLPSHAIGVGFGVFKCASNAGSTIMDILVGVIQDRTAHQGYAGVWLTFVVIAVCGMCLVAALAWVQARYYGNLLEKPARATVMARANEDDNVVEVVELIHESQKRQWWYVVVFAAYILLAWILFFVFTVHGHIKSN